MHEGDVVTVEGEIMHKPKASALAAQDRYYIARVLLTYPKQLLVFEKCALFKSLNAR